MSHEQLADALADRYLLDEELGRDPLWAPLKSHPTFASLRATP